MTRLSFDKIIHERARLAILIHLANNSKQKITFNELKEDLDLTSGNLSVQLTNLEQAGYVQIHKSFQNKKPVTKVSLTPEGLSALKNYLLEMEEMIKTIKKLDSE